MSPILVRPVREQLEHDRVIRLLQARARRRYDVGINPGAEQNAAVGSGAAAQYPDLILTSTERGRRVEAVIEVETTESVNHLEAMAQWPRLARLRAPFHLYVPAGSVDVARRLCADNDVDVAEIWTYHTIGDQIRFTMVYRAPLSPHARPRAEGARRQPAASVRSAPARSRAKGVARPLSKKSSSSRKTTRAQKRK